VAFGLTPNYPEANLRHYAFMVEGLTEVQRKLAERRILFLVRVGNPAEVALELAQEAAAVVMDSGYLRHQRAWREQVAKNSPCLALEVEGEVVVPVRLAYPKEAWSAQALRRKISPLLERFLRPLPELEPEKSSLGLDLPCQDLRDPLAVLAGLPLDRSVPPLGLPSGTEAARARLLEFLEKKLSRYPEDRNNPGVDGTSGLSPYLHFGQISPVEVAWRAARVGGPGAQAFLEELIVRRELAVNFVFYNPNYDRFEGLPAWA
jgi:deoxyribodipyrimidine photo-lyase